MCSLRYIYNLYMYVLGCCRIVAGCFWNISGVENDDLLLSAGDSGTGDYPF